MTNEDYNELDALFAENARMKKALTDIATAPMAFITGRSAYSKRNLGLLSGLKAAANIALDALKETTDGRQEDKGTEAPSPSA